MWLAWKSIGLILMIIVYFLLVYWQRRHWRSPSTEIGIVAITMMFFDELMTWLGQPVSYWQKNISIEHNPIGEFLLELHPMAFVAAFIFYMIIIIAVIRILSRWSRFTMVVISGTIILAHAYYALNWFSSDSASVQWTRWISNRMDDMPFMYLPFIIIGLIFGLLLIQKRKK